MKVEDIYARLDEIRAMVAAYAAKDGTIQVDPFTVHVTTEFCMTELRKAFERAQDRDYGID